MGILTTVWYRGVIWYWIVMNLCTNRIWKNRNCVFAESLSSFKTGERRCLGAVGGCLICLLVGTVLLRHRSWVFCKSAWVNTTEISHFNLSEVTTQNHTDPISLLGVNGFGVVKCELVLHPHYGVVLLALHCSPVRGWISDCFSGSHISCYCR